MAVSTLNPQASPVCGDHAQDRIATLQPRCSAIAVLVWLEARRRSADTALRGAHRYQASEFSGNTGLKGLRVTGLRVGARNDVRLMSSPMASCSR